MNNHHVSSTPAKQLLLAFARRFALRFSGLLTVSTLTASTMLGLVICQPLFGQQPSRRSAFPDFPFSNPEKMFEQLFGRDTPEERARLAEVPVSSREEAKVGTDAVRAYLAGLEQRRIRVTRRGPDVEYLQKLVNQIKPFMQNGKKYRHITVYLVEDDAPDARSFPGATLFFFRGLLEFAESEAALVGVVGHELSHLDRGHQLDTVRRIKLARQTTQSGQFSPEMLFQNSTMFMKMFTRPFRPEQETEADADGATWAHHAGYDAREMATLFRRMHERDGGAAAPGTVEFLRSHPYHLDRYQAVQRLYADLQAKTPLTAPYVGRRNLTERTPLSERRFE